MPKLDLRHKQVQDVIKQYHQFSFKLANKHFYSNIPKERIAEMENFVNTINDLIKCIRENEGIRYIDQFVHNKKDNFHCSISNYYYKRKKIDNILWKYLFDC